jgi:hypothetical protein
MAFELETTLPTGVSGNYWRLGFVQVVCNEDPYCTVSMDLYLNKQAKTDGKSLMERRNTNIPLMDIDASYSFDFRACIYNALKQYPEWANAVDIYDDPNKVPVTRTMSLETAMETELEFPFYAYDPYNVPLTFIIVDQPTNGTATQINGVCTYTPDAGFAGTDTFTYQATNGEFTSDPALITVVVPSLYPVAEDSNVETNMNADLEITLSGTDPQNLSLSFTASNPSHGTITQLDDVITYTPETDYVGGDSFTFTASNGTYTSESATVSITVNTLVPTANDVSSMTPTNTEVFITAIAIDPSGTPLSYSIVLPPANGIAIESNGVFTYTPNTDYVGIDTFTYKVSNGTYESLEATVTINVGV